MHFNFIDTLYFVIVIVLLSLM